MIISYIRTGNIYKIAANHNNKIMTTFTEHSYLFF